MKFVPGGDGVWLLIDETAPSDANLIATVAGPVEILALKALCESRITSAERPAHFDITHDGRRYLVTPFADRDNRISLRINGSDGSLARIETEFKFADE